jgi:hypothetical protein
MYFVQVSVLFADRPSSNYQISGYNTNFNTTYLLTKGHMSIFVVKSIVIQIIGLRRDLSIKPFEVRLLNADADQFQ